MPTAAWRVSIVGLIAAVALLCSVRSPSVRARPEVYSDSFTISGLVETPLTITAPELQLLGGSSSGADCGGTVGERKWSEVPVAGLIMAAGLITPANYQSDLRNYFVQVSGADGRSRLISWTQLGPGDRFEFGAPRLAVALNGTPLGQDGGEAALIVDACDDSQNIFGVQSITVSAAPLPVGSAPGAQPAPNEAPDITTAAGLQALALQPDDAPGYTRFYVSQGVSGPFFADDLGPITFSDIWAGVGGSQFLKTMMSSYTSVDKAATVFAEVVPQTFPRSYGCSQRDITASVPQGVGDEDASASWSCTYLGQPATFYEETFRRGAVSASLVLIDRLGTGSLDQVVAWAQTLDASLTAAQQ